jgi:hypothetical protein
VGLFSYKDTCLVSESIWPIQEELLPFHLLQPEGYKFLCDMDVLTRPTATAEKETQSQGTTVTTTGHVANFVVPEPEDSSLYLQQPTTGAYPEPTKSTLHPPSQSPQNPF